MNRPLCQRERAATSPEGGAGKACGLDGEGVFVLPKTKMQTFCKFLLQFASEACIISLARKCKLIAIYCNKAHYSCFWSIKWNCFWMFWANLWWTPPRCCPSCFWPICSLNMCRTATASASKPSWRGVGAGALFRRRCWAVCHSAVSLPLRPISMRPGSSAWAR